MNDYTLALLAWLAVSVPLLRLFPGEVERARRREARLLRSLGRCDVNRWRP